MLGDCGTNTHPRKAQFILLLSKIRHLTRGCLFSLEPATMLHAADPRFPYGWSMSTRRSQPTLIAPNISMSAARILQRPEISD